MTHMCSSSTDILNLGSLSRECVCRFLWIWGLISSDSVCEESGVLRLIDVLSAGILLTADSCGSLPDETVVLGATQDDGVALSLSVLF